MWGALRAYPQELLRHKLKFTPAHRIIAIRLRQDCNGWCLVKWMRTREGERNYSKSIGWRKKKKVFSRANLHKFETQRLIKFSTREFPFHLRKLCKRHLRCSRVGSEVKNALLSAIASTVKNTLNAYLIKAPLRNAFVSRHKLNFTNYAKSFSLRNMLCRGRIIGCL